MCFQMQPHLWLLGHSSYTGHRHALVSHLRLQQPVQGKLPLPAPTSELLSLALELSTSWTLPTGHLATAEQCLPHTRQHKRPHSRGRMMQSPNRLWKYVSLRLSPKPFFIVITSDLQRLAAAANLYMCLNMYEPTQLLANFASITILKPKRLQDLASSHFLF